MLPPRNTEALRPKQVAYCRAAWQLVTEGRRAVPLDVTRAGVAFSMTGYSEEQQTVYLGANAYPRGGAVDANGRLSVLACLIHEYAHAEAASPRLRSPQGAARRAA